MEFSAKQIAAFIQGEIIGDENATVHTFAKIEEGMPGAISFLSNPKYTPYIYETQSSIVLVNKDFVPEHEIRATLIKVDNAYESLAKLLNLYEMSKPKKQGIDSLAYIAPSAKIGENVYIGAFAYIGENAVIGDNTQIYPHTFVGDGVKIGNGCLLYSNVNVYHDCRIGNECILLLMKRYRQVWRMLIKKADSFPNGQVPDIVSVWSVIILHRWLPTHF